MADKIFSIRFIPTGSSQISSDTWDVPGLVYDGDSFFSGFDVQVGDSVYLDTYNSLTAPYTVSKYTVLLTNSRSSGSVNLRLKYIDTGTPVDPSEISGSSGFVCRTSTSHKLAWHAAPTTHNISDYVIQNARNQESFSIIDTFGSGGGSVLNAKQMVAGEAIGVGKPVSKRSSDGKILLAESDGGIDRQNIIGVSITSAAAVDSIFSVQLNGNVAGAISGLGFSVGQDIFVGEIAGSYTNDPSVFTGNNDILFKVGVADCAAGIASSVATDLIMFFEVVSR